MELTPLDYKLLEFIFRNQPITMPDILEEFSSNMDTVKYRLRLLRTPKCSQTFPVGNGSYIFEDELHTKDENGFTQAEGSGKFSLTEMGKKSLEDYNLSKKYPFKKFITPLNILKILGVFFIAVLSRLTDLYSNELRAWIDSAISWFPH